MSAPDSSAIQLPLTQRGTRPSVLIVEDHREVRESLRAALEQMRIYAAAAHDGETALKIAQAMRFDLVILDVLLPGMNGFEVSRALRELPQLRAVPILFATCVTGAEAQALGAKLGAHYLCKPFGLPELQARVEQILIGEAQGKQQALL